MLCSEFVTFGSLVPLEPAVLAFHSWFRSCFGLRSLTCVLPSVLLLMARLPAHQAIVNEFLALATALVELSWFMFFLVPRISPIYMSILL